MFLDTTTHLYKRSFPSDRPSVRPSVHPSVRLTVCPSVGPSVPRCFQTTNMAVFEGKKSSNDIIINHTISDDEEVVSAVPPWYSFDVFSRSFRALSARAGHLSPGRRFWRRSVGRRPRMERIFATISVHVSPQWLRAHDCRAGQSRYRIPLPSHQSSLYVDYGDSFDFWEREILVIEW